LKTRGFRTSSLFRPDLNIQFGCYYLRDLIDTHEGSREAALAAYNGGSLRAENWLTWATYKEPAEFVETIPFTETRTYVQAVLRNAWMYSRIYGPAAAKR
jgi:soluble lytic murein transglycosylase